MNRQIDHVFDEIYRNFLVTFKPIKVRFTPTSSKFQTNTKSCFGLEEIQTKEVKVN